VAGDVTGPSTTRFGRALAAAGSEDALLDELRRSFVDALGGDSVDQEALDRWRDLLVATASAGPRDLDAESGYFTRAVKVLHEQLVLLAPGSLGPGLVEQLRFLADDLQDHDDPALREAGGLLAALVGS
jgi:hypothetical protein